MLGGGVGGSDFDGADGDALHHGGGGYVRLELVLLRSPLEFGHDILASTCVHLFALWMQLPTPCITSFNSCDDKQLT